MREKVFIWEKVDTLPRVTLPSKRVTLHSGSPGPPSQLRATSCKRYAAIHNEMYEKFYRLGWLGKEGNPPTRDNSSPYKQALTPKRVAKGFCVTCDSPKISCVTRDLPKLATWCVTGHHNVIRDLLFYNVWSTIHISVIGKCSKK